MTPQTQNKVVTDQQVIRAWLGEQDSETRVRILAMADRVQKCIPVRRGGAGLGEGGALEVLYAIGRLAGGATKVLTADAQPLIMGGDE